MEMEYFKEVKSAIDDLEKKAKSMDFEEMYFFSEVIDKKEFLFDNAYDEFSTNEVIYIQNIRPMIFGAFYSKYKITCFAYGQTGSGKTYTMMGANQGTGIGSAGMYMLAGYDIFNIKIKIHDSMKIENIKNIAVSRLDLHDEMVRYSLRIEGIVLNKDKTALFYNLKNKRNLFMHFTFLEG